MGLINTKKPKNKIVENCLCEKQKYIRYVVVKFKNQTYGVLDKDHYHFVNHDSPGSGISREDHSRILFLGQTTLQKAKNLAKSLNKEVENTSYEEIQ